MILFRAVGQVVGAVTFGVWEWWERVRHTR